MRENLVLSTNTKCMKAEVLFVEDSKEIEHPIKTNWKTEQKKKKKELEERKWRRARQQKDSKENENKRK